MSKKITQEEFEKKLYKKHNNKIIALEEYKKARSKILFKCTICGHEWYTSPSYLLQGHGCRKCASKLIHDKQRKTTEQFKKELYQKFGDMYTVLGKYTGANKKILVKCNKCNYQWLITPNHILNDGVGCPHCTLSKGENRIEQWLRQNDINYIEEYKFDDCKDKSLLRFDFYLPDYNCCIEYDGQQHFEVVDFTSKDYRRAVEQFKQIQIRDRIKDEYCKTHNIPLLRIPYTEFDNIENILENFLKSLFYYVDKDGNLIYDESKLIIL